MVVSFLVAVYFQLVNVAEDQHRSRVIRQRTRENHPEPLSGSIGDAMDPEALQDKVQGIVAARLNELTPQLVKEIVQDMIRAHLGWLVVWGGVFGGLIGLITSMIQQMMSAG